MANGQITDKEVPLKIYGGIPVEFIRHDSVTIKGVLCMSPAGSWEILAVDAKFMLDWAQKRLVGGNMTNGSFPTHPINLDGVRIASIVLTETQPTPTGV